MDRGLRAWSGLFTLLDSPVTISSHGPFGFWILGRLTVVKFDKIGDGSEYVIAL